MKDVINNNVEANTNENENNVSKNIDAAKTGKFIRELRTSHNLTQEELGSELFITRKAVSKWETGKCCPSIDVLKKLADSLGVTVEELINGKLNEPDLSDMSRVKRFFYKMSRSKSVKKTIIFTIFIIILTLLIFYFENYKSTKVYTIFYEDDNFALSNGSVLISNKKEYLNLGYLYNNLIDVDSDTKFNYTIYVKDSKGNELTLASFSSSDYALKENIGYDGIDTKVIRNNIDNFFLKIEYENIYDEEKVYDLHLNYKLDYESGENYSNANSRKSMDVLESTFSEFNNVTNANVDVTTANSEDDMRYIDVSFLYEMTSSELKSKFDGKEISIDNEEYKITFQKSDRVIIIENEKCIIYIKLEDKICIINNIENKSKLNNYKINDEKNLEISVETVDYNVLNKLLKELKLCYHK